MITITFRFKGGSGSGNYGHSGRPGKIGGSSGGGSSEYDNYIPGGGRSGNTTESHVDSRARSMLYEMISKHPRASIDDAQDFVYQVADKLLQSGDDIPESWFEMLDELYSYING